MSGNGIRAHLDQKHIPSVRAETDIQAADLWWELVPAGRPKPARYCIVLGLVRRFSSVGTGQVASFANVSMPNLLPPLTKLRSLVDSLGSERLMLPGLHFSRSLSYRTTLGQHVAHGIDTRRGAQ